MTGFRNGVAAKLRETVTTLINIHCIYYRLTLACNDANDSLTPISQVETVLRQLWIFFENSAARSAVYVQISSEKSKGKLATKAQKACRTRWLSLDKSVESVCRNLLALLQTLRWYQNKDSNPTAIGLLKKLKKPDFIGVLYILKGVLPVLLTLSKVFQKSSIFFPVFFLPSKHLKTRLTGLFKKTSLSKSSERRQQLENLLAWSSVKTRLKQQRQRCKTYAPNM